MNILLMHSREFALVVMMLLVSCGILLAGTTGKIVGEVKDSKTGEPIIGANVLIEGTTLGAATNFEGYYVILNVKPGIHNVVISAVGYIKTTIVGVSVSVDLTTTVNAQLEQTVLELGQEVVITAERPIIQKDLTSSEARVSAEQIKTLPVREVHEVLALQAGITQDRFGGLHIRGGRSNEVAYWVDGVSISDVYDGSQAVQVDNKSVQELQVISGTFNAEYGQAMSGIVNIVTKDGDQNFRAIVSAYSGDYFTSNSTLFTNLDKIRPGENRNVEASFSGPFPGIPDMTFYASGRYLYTDGWLYGKRFFVPMGTDSTKSSTGEFLGFRGDSGAVAMNNRERLSGQAKLTYQFSPEMKLSVSGLLSRIEYKDFSQAWRLLPDGDVKKFDRGYNLSALWTHALSPTSFYTLNVSYFLKDFKEHLYESPFDSSYVLDPNATATQLYEFIHKGTNLHQFKRRTETRIAKLDYMDQISRLHLIKAGLEVKLHRLYLEDYNIVQDPNNATRPIIPRFDSAVVNPVSGEVTLHPTSYLYQEYTEKPVEFSAYIQDKLEYDRMVVNIGVRFDYFHSHGKVLADPLDPNVYLPQKIQNQFRDLNSNGKKDDGEPEVSLAERLSYWYKEASPKFSISPRLGISYPITDKGALHFSYGHFLQIPSFQYLYQLPGYKVTTASGVQGVYGNPDLNPQKTVMYELGLQQQLSDVLNFDVTGFYRDIRDWVSTSAQFAVRDPATATTYYTFFVNKDYANARGITFTLNKRMRDMYTVNLSYTFQIAEGVNSNPDEEQAALAARPGLDIVPEKVLTPLDWDQTHTLNLTLGFGQEDWGAFILGRYGSGLPYTAVINQADIRGQDAARAVQKNTRRRPANYTADIRLYKNFNLGGLANFSLFLKVFNIFDRRNEIDVYGQTGHATATPQALGVGAVSGGNRVNTIEEYLLRPDFYSEPREIQLGLEISL